MNILRGAVPGSCCGNLNRRSFLADCGMGFTGLVLGAMLERDGIARASQAQGLTDAQAHLVPVCDAPFGEETGPTAPHRR